MRGMLRLCKVLMLIEEEGGEEGVRVFLNKN